MTREPKGNKILVCWTCKELGHYSSKYLKRKKKSKSRKPYKSRIPKDFFFVNEDDEFDFKMVNLIDDSDDEDDEIGFVDSKEESPQKEIKEEVREDKALLSHVKKKMFDWNKDSSFSHYMTIDMNDFLK